MTRARIETIPNGVRITNISEPLREPNEPRMFFAVGQKVYEWIKTRPATKLPPTPNRDKEIQMEKEVAKALVDAIENGASPESIIRAFQEECARRCPAHAPSFLQRLKESADSMFD